LVEIPAHLEISRKIDSLLLSVTLLALWMIGLGIVSVDDVDAGELRQVSRSSGSFWE
jgi:hypothetical protein